MTHLQLTQKIDWSALRFQLAPLVSEPNAPTDLKLTVMGAYARTVFGYFAGLNHVNSSQQNIDAKWYISKKII